MLPEDTALWNAYLDTDPWPNAKAAYDVHVGTPPPERPDLSEAMQRDLYALYTKRIDAVILLPTETLVIEVKPNASTSAIGQALCYALIFHREHPTLPTPKPVILTDTPHVDTPWLCDRLNVILIALADL
jgi:hypothetical protein